MRIAYVCQYQGPALIASRGVVRNRTLGGNRKIEMITDLLRRAGHDVVVLSGGMPADRTLQWFGGFESATASESGGGARVVYAAGWDAPYANLAVAITATVRNALREARKARFDAVLLYNINEFSVAVAAALRSACPDVPLVLEYEDAVDMSSRGVSRPRRAVWQALESWLTPRVSGVLAVNDLLVQRIGAANAYVLRGMVSDGLCDLGAGRPAPFSTSGVPVALFSGSFAWEKGLQRLVDIVPRFAGRLRFVVSGAGPLEPLLREAQQRYPDDLEVLGFLSREELEQRLLRADVLLNPHDDDRGSIFPFKVIEYLAAGGVVVTTRCGLADDPAFDFCEMASTSDFASAVEHVLANPAAATARASSGQRWASATYSMSAVAQSVARVIDAAVPTGNGVQAERR